MPLTSLTLLPPVRHLPRATPLDPDVLDDAVALFDAGRHLEAVQRALAHLLPDADLGDLRERPLIIGQGSSRVFVRAVSLASGLELDVRVPLIRLSAEGNPTAALRYLLSRVAGSGQLYQPRLYEDNVVLEFREPLARMHPIKLLEVLRRMPVEADACDDWMIAEFGALPLDREPISALDVDELARAEAIWDAHWAEVEELVKESQRKRSLFFLNELSAFTIYHLRATLPLAGALGTRINESASVFHDTDEDPNKREQALAKCAKEMRAVPREVLHKNLGHARYAISPWEEGTPEVLRNQLSADNLETVRRVRTGGGALDATLALSGTFSFLLARFSWPAQFSRGGLRSPRTPTIAEGLLAGFALAHQKPLREASQALLAHAKALLESVDSDEDDEEDEDDEAADEDTSAGDEPEGAGA